ncbi:molybdopterin molybdotransferase MoeA [Candidatus Bathyarchaeota archaeon]|nr:molybdopterin molybdotransferase MoeA [Candidatus Bathyarchaeota archaeon]
MALKKMPRRVTAIEEAARLFYKSLRLERLQTEVTLVEDALGRVLAVDVAAPEDLPALDRSAVDGYAVIARDTFGASPGNPVILRLASIDSRPDSHLRNGEAVYVDTGSPLPVGSDAVVMVEFTSKISPDTIEVYKAVAPHDDVSWRGEDVKMGEVALKEGTRLEPQDLGMLVALGISEVQVYKRPLVGILSTGSELAPPGQGKRRGEVTDVNSIVLSSMVRRYGGTPVPMGCIRDDFESIRSMIMDGLGRCDLMVVTGGTSEGQADLTVEAIDSLGKPGVVVHGVAVRPGRPTALASINGKPVINLSGYPVAAMIGFYLFGRPLLARMLRTSQDIDPCVRARVTRRIPAGPGLRSFVRVRVLRSGGAYLAEPVRSTGSGVISSMINANGFVVIPEHVEGVDENEEVDVVLFRPILEHTGSNDFPGYPADPDM